MLFKNLFTSFNNIDEKIKKMIKIGLYFSASLSIISSLILFTYLTYIKTLTVYYLGLSILKLAIILATAFIVAGLGTDRIKNEFKNF